MKGRKEKAAEYKKKAEAGREAKTALRGEEGGESLGHHPNLPEHRTTSDAMRAVPVFLELYRGAPGVDIADGIHAGSVIVDYASSLFHSKPLMETATTAKEEGKETRERKAKLTEEEAVAQLESFAEKTKDRSRRRGTKTESEAFADAESIPWALVVPVVMEILKRLFDRWKKGESR